MIDIEKFEKIEEISQILARIENIKTPEWNIHSYTSAFHRMEILNYRYTEFVNQFVHESYRQERKKTRNVETNEVDHGFESLFNENFISINQKITASLCSIFNEIIEIQKGFELFSKRDFNKYRGMDGMDFDNLSFSKMINMNHSIKKRENETKDLLKAIETFVNFDITVVNGLNSINKYMEEYHNCLIDRHEKKGHKINVNPVINDIAICVYDNITLDGRKESSGPKNTMSRYSMLKARIMLSFLNDTNVKNMIAKLSAQNELVSVYETELELIRDFIENNDSMLKDIARSMKPVLSDMSRKRLDFMESVGESRDFGQEVFIKIESIRAVTLNDICVDADITKSPEEIEMARVTDEAIKKIVIAIMQRLPDSKILEIAIEAKNSVEETKRNKNKFYVSKIGSGDTAMGIAPGALYIVPSQRPIASLDEIFGSGFDEVRDFIKSVDQAERFQDIYLSTSPSKTTDKANVLLVGPPGCGKTEVLRSICSCENSIGVFANGSDFKTCWKGETEKNPKRLFESGISLYRETKKRVYFLLDEIDAIVNNDYSSGETNLTLEFQQLMDGVVNYKGVAIWATTNNLQRIPMAMIRRFSKVLVVGELSLDDRVNLLKKFMKSIPSKVSNETYQQVGVMLDGATGDVIRKIADSLWRTTTSKFIKNYPSKAEELSAMLAKETISPHDNDFKLKQKMAVDFISQFESVSDRDILELTEKSLLDIGINSEIESAKEIYAITRDFIEEMKNGKQKNDACQIQQIKQAEVTEVPIEIPIEIPIETPIEETKLEKEK